MGRLSMENQHFLLVSLPYQSHVNPTLALANKLTRAGAHVTFVTTVHGLNKLKSRPSIHRLSFASFSDGHDTDSTAVKDPIYFDELKRVGYENFKNLILSTFSQEGQQVTFLVYSLMLPWVAELARELHLPSAFFFIQSATSFSFIYNFFKSNNGDESFELPGSFEFPGLPIINYSDIPTFLLPTNAYALTLAPIFEEHIRTLEADPNGFMLINTFHDLEQNSIESIPKSINIIPIGPLLPYESDNGVICDLFPCSDHRKYIDWLDSKPEKSVIYVSFGSIVELQRKQKEEIFHGLIQTNRPFLWILRDYRDDEEEVIKGFNGGDGGGLIVRWCSQVEVLNHVAIGCFVTHGGWNSTVESMAAGVAVVGCPQFSDQKVNMKMVEDVWGNGLRAAADGGGVVGREEIERCLAVVMGGGERGEEIKKNVEKWKWLAMEAINQGGSSHTNLHQFFKSV